MFSLLSGFWQYFFTKPRLNILVIGLDYSGKTTLLEKIKGMFGRLPSIPPEKIPPTIGMNLARIFYQGHQIVMWDLGGQIKMRNIWENYYNDANAIVFVVDSSDINRLEEAKLAFEAVCDHDSVSNIPIFIFANKQDLSGALTGGELAINFYSVQDSADRSRVLPISALTGEGMEIAMNTILDGAKKSVRTSR